MELFDLELELEKEKESSNEVLDQSLLESNEDSLLGIESTNAASQIVRIQGKE